MLDLLESQLTSDQTWRSPSHKRTLVLETAQAIIEEPVVALVRRTTVVEATSRRAESIATPQAHKIRRESETIAAGPEMTTAVPSPLALADETTSIDTTAEDEADHALHSIAVTADHQSEMVEWKMICRYLDAIREMFRMCRLSLLMILIVNSSSGRRSRSKHVVCV